MMALLADTTIALLIVALSAWIIATADVTRAVIGFIVYGLMLTVIWVRLSAVDVALTEAAIGGGLTGLLLLKAAWRLRSARLTTQPAGVTLFAAALLSATVAVGLAAAIVTLPEPAPTLAPLAVENLERTGLGNPVAAVLFAYRALDTLLEKIVLLLALLGVWSLASGAAWTGAPHLRSPISGGGTLGLLARHLPPFGIVFGIYMCWIGADEPGGAFQGGTVIAAMWLLVIIAGLVRAPPIGNIRLRLMLVVGPAIFVAIGVAGLAIKGSFLAYPPDHAKLLIVTIELALTLSIAAVLGMLAAGPPTQEPGL